MQLLTSDLFDTMVACVKGHLPECPATFDTSRSAVGIMLVSGGYPGSYKKGFPITGQLSLFTVVRFGSKVGQIGPK